MNGPPTCYATDTDAASPGPRWGRSLAAIAVADLRERTRRPAYRVTLAAVGWLAYHAVVGNIILRLGDWRGEYDAAWSGALLTLVATTFLSLAGFYLVKGGVERDRVTGVGQILATTPLGKAQYVLGKWLSNLAVLASYLLILALAAPLMLLFAEEAAFPGPLAFVHHVLLPLALLAFPALALVAALALLFELVPGLGGGLGNAVWVFVWAAGLGVAALAGVDAIGIQPLMSSMRSALEATTGESVTGFNLTIRGGFQGTLATFRWPGLVWTPALVVARLGWLAACLLPLALAVALFDRFAERAGRQAARPSGTPRQQRTLFAVLLARLPWRGAVATTTLLLAAERGIWWWIGLAGLWIAQLTAPAAALSDLVLPLAWLWPLLAWSSLGCREERAATTGLVWTAPGGPTRLLAIDTAAGVLVALACGLPTLVRLAPTADGPTLLRLAIALFAVPALAVGCGALSRGPKLFEAGYTVLWYLGPMQGESPLDWIAGRGASPSLPLALAALAAGVLATALLVRHRRLATA